MGYWEIYDISHSISVNVAEDVADTYLNKNVSQKIHHLPYETRNSNDAWLKLDETGVRQYNNGDWRYIYISLLSTSYCSIFDKNNGYISSELYKEHYNGCFTQYYKINYNDSYFVDDSYCQLYIPYSTFKSACQQIKSVYSANPDGYFKYMKYWARNGEYNQICDYGENTGAMDGTIKVNNTYLASNFWNHYDGTKDPVTGQVWKDENGNIIPDKRANGW